MGATTFISTDPVAMAAAERALEDMGRPDYLSTLLLDGPPGCGKTFLAKQLAIRLDAELIQFQFYPGSSHRELLFDMTFMKDGVPSEGVLPRAIAASHQKPVVLLLDELDKTEAATDAFLLNFLNENLLYVPQLGELRSNAKNILIVITKNDQRPATEPLLRRCRCVQMAWPKPEVEVKIMQQLLPGFPEAACLAMIEPANRMREHPQIRKKPSTPEVVRLARDLQALLKENATPQLLGRYFINGMLPVITDREHFRENSVALGARIQETFPKAAPASSAPPVPAEPVPAGLR
ncbi:MAG: MoxR family ATPase [Verrucomicrobium sp.]|nr:MoxR family ATPase [Verrucomicrobium sp.]